MLHSDHSLAVGKYPQFGFVAIIVLPSMKFPSRKENRSLHIDSL